MIQEPSCSIKIEDNNTIIGRVTTINVSAHPDDMEDAIKKAWEAAVFTVGSKAEKNEIIDSRK